MWITKSKYALFSFILFFSFCENTKEPIKSGFVEIGEASWYGPGLQGNKTASGVKFDMNLLTAAHKKLEFGTFVRVINLENKKEVIVEINDRGPVPKKRILDLSKKAAQKIDLIDAGHTEVEIQIIGYTENNISALLKHYRNLQIIKYGKVIF